MTTQQLLEKPTDRRAQAVGQSSLLGSGAPSPGPVLSQRAGRHDDSRPNAPAVTPILVGWIRLLSDIIVLLF